VKAEYFMSAFKCVPEKTASSPSGRGNHHYKDYDEGSSANLSVILYDVYDAIITPPLKQYNAQRNESKPSM
jgi:hypothetical protein